MGWQWSQWNGRRACCLFSLTYSKKDSALDRSVDCRSSRVASLPSHCASKTALSRWVGAKSPGCTSIYEGCARLLDATARFTRPSPKHENTQKINYILDKASAAVMCRGSDPELLRRQIVNCAWDVVWLTRLCHSSAQLLWLPLVM